MFKLHQTSHQQLKLVLPTVVQGTPKDIKLNATDPDTDDKLVFSLVNGPQNGQLGEINQENGVVSYTPNEGYTGDDTFTYKVNDGTVDSEPIQVTITCSSSTKQATNSSSWFYLCCTGNSKGHQTQCY